MCTFRLNRLSHTHTHTLSLFVRPVFYNQVGRWLAIASLFRSYPIMAPRVGVSNPHLRCFRFPLTKALSRIGLPYHWWFPLMSAEVFDVSTNGLTFCSTIQHLDDMSALGRTHCYTLASPCLSLPLSFHSLSSFPFNMRYLFRRKHYHHCF